MNSAHFYITQNNRTALCSMSAYSSTNTMVLYCRLLNIQIGEASRRAWLGEEADPQYSDRLLRPYKRPVEVYMDQQDSRWFISKDAIVSGLGLLGIKQGGPETTLSKPRRKRVVRKKVASG
jgi:hypothetical protein